MTKDYLKFRNAIKKDENLSLEEAYLLEHKLWLCIPIL